jgi:CBS domain-containing protein
MLVPLELGARTTMFNNDDDMERQLEEEHPGPEDLESALISTTLTDVVKKAPLLVASQTSMAVVLQAMRDDDRGAALVVEAGKLVGIFTKRDVLMKVAGQPIDLTQSEINTFMTCDPVTLPVDSIVAFALNRMVLEGFRHIPLMDDENRPVAVVSMRNVIEYLSEYFNRETMNLPPDPRIRSNKREGA